MNGGGYGFGVDAMTLAFANAVYLAFAIPYIVIAAIEQLTTIDIRNIACSTYKQYLMISHHCQHGSH